MFWNINIMFQKAFYQQVGPIFVTYFFMNAHGAQQCSIASHYCYEAALCMLIG